MFRHRLSKREWRWAYPIYMLWPVLLLLGGISALDHGEIGLGLFFLGLAWLFWMIINLGRRDDLEVEQRMEEELKEKLEEARKKYGVQ